MWDLCEEDQSYQQDWSSSIKNTPLDLVLMTKEQLKFKASNYFDDLNPFVYTPYTTLHSVLRFHFTSIQLTFWIPYWENMLSQTITQVEISCENSHAWSKIGIKSNFSFWVPKTILLSRDHRNRLLQYSDLLTALILM